MSSSRLATKLLKFEKKINHGFRKSKGNMAPTLKEKLINKWDYLAHKDVDELISLGADVLKYVVDAVEKPSTINIIKNSFNVWKLLNDSKMYSDEYFRQNWDYPYNLQFGTFIVDALCQFPYKVIKPAENDMLVKIANVFGEEVGWVCTPGKSEISEGVYVRSERLEAARSVIKQALWNKIACRSIVMEKMKSSGNKSSDSINFKKDNDLVGLQSQKADEMAEYLQRCIDAQVPRTILLYGRPGTGKSTIAHAITDKLQLRTLRIRVEDISDFDNTVIFEAINVFEPDAIILDDLDRSLSQSHLLETMQRFHRHVKLVFATVNNRDALDEALMRPGRFDQIEHIRRLDDIVIKKILGKDSADMFETVKDWPIAFIEEYTIRRKFMTKEEAFDSLKELQKRVDRLGHDEDEEKNSQLFTNGDAQTQLDNDDLEMQQIQIPSLVKKYVKKIRLK